MDGLAEIGMFFIGLGILLLGCGLMWFISEWSKIAKENGGKNNLIFSLRLPAGRQCGLRDVIMLAVERTRDVTVLG
ncbi:MAG: hypothetical protein JSW38_04890 [Dehalococcoidia bacterium]|nr:MAG: hypothetical protein JSW38_04890 [Dehalococcoidia bacterium]